MKIIYKGERSSYNFLLIRFVDIMDLTAEDDNGNPHPLRNPIDAASERGEICRDYINQYHLEYSFAEVWLIIERKFFEWFDYLL